MTKKKPKSKADAGVPIYCAYDKLVNIGDLKPNPDNPNMHPDNQIEILEKLIREHGWRNPITVSNRSGLIVRGHGRYMAAIMGGFIQAPVDFQDYESDEAETLDLIADNKIAELSIVDDDLAHALLVGLGDVDLSLAGFDLGGLPEIFKESYNDDEEDGEEGFVPDKDPNVLVRLSFHPGMWLGKRSEIVDITEKLKKTYNCEVKIEE